MDLITIIFGTEMGTAESCAERLAEGLMASNLESEVIDMDDYDHADLAKEGLLLVIVSTTGSGDPPSNARNLFSHLAEDRPDLTGRNFAVLALGDSYHANFAQCGKDFDRMLGELGASRVIDRVDCDGAVDAPLKQFQNNLLDYFDEENDRYPMYTREEIVGEEPAPESNDEESAFEPEAEKKGILSRVKRRIVSKIRRLLSS